MRNAGFRSVSLADWSAAIHHRRPLPERSVIITFDDAFKSFTTYALPALKKYGFSAVVFVVCRYAGATNAWDADVEHVPLLDWQEIRELAALGIEFGSHSMTHPPLTGIPNADVLREATESKAILERELQRPVSAFAYPYGDTDPIVQQLVAQAGYTVAVTTRFARASLNDSPMALPRLDVSAHDDLATFIRNLDA
jgi:peptidoglycan/xylan/chitin deacetylase (PgdA/CDA1 family)